MVLDAQRAIREGRMSQDMTSVRRELTTPRAAAVAGILFSLLLMASLVLIRLAIPDDPLGAASDVKAHAKAITLALNMLPFAGIAFLWFIAVVRDRLGELEDRFFVTVFLGSGYLFIATLFFSAAKAGGILTVLGSGQEALLSSGAYALGRAEVYQSVHVYAMRMAAVFMMTTSTVGLRTRIFPRWMSRLGFVLALALLLSVGTFAWAPMLFPAWVLMISVHVLTGNLLGRQPGWDQNATVQGEPHDPVA
jgi:hypothetical protein